MIQPFHKFPVKKNTNDEMNGVELNGLPANNINSCAFDIGFSLHSE